MIPSFVYRRIEQRPRLVRIFDNIGWLFFDRALRMGVGLLVGVWLARYLGPEQFGLFNYALALVALFGAVATLGLQGIVVRNIVQEPATREDILGTAALLQVLAGVLAYVLLLGAIFWLRPDDGLAKTIVVILGFVLLFKCCEVANYWFESQVQSKYVVWVQNAGFLVFAGIKIVLILMDAPLVTFAWAVLAEGLVVALLVVLNFTFRVFALSRLKASFITAKKLLLDSWPLLLSSVAIVIYMKVDQIMLGQMSGDEAVGVYAAATRVSEIWYFLPMVIVASVFPSILEAKKLGRVLYERRLQRLYALMVWMSLAVAVPMTFLATPIVTLLYGQVYLESGLVLAIHIWASVFVFLGVASGQWFLAENRQILSLQRTVVGLIVNIVLNLILIPRYGVIGAAVATVVAQFSVGIVFDAFQRETHPMLLMKIKAFNPLQLNKKTLFE